MSKTDNPTLCWRKAPWSCDSFCLTDSKQDVEIIVDMFWCENVSHYVVELCVMPSMQQIQWTEQVKLFVVFNTSPNHNQVAAKPDWWIPSWGYAAVIRREGQLRSGKVRTRCPYTQAFTLRPNYWRTSWWVAGTSSKCWHKNRWADDYHNRKRLSIKYTNTGHQNDDSNRISPGSNYICMVTWSMRHSGQNRTIQNSSAFNGEMLWL